MAISVAIKSVLGASNVVDHIVTGAVDATDAGAAVTVFDGASVLGTAGTDGSGNWELPFVFADDGPTHTYALTATATNAGQSATSDPVPFAIDSTPNESLFGSIIHDTSTVSGQVFEAIEGLFGRVPTDAEYAAYTTFDAGSSRLIPNVRSMITSVEWAQKHPLLALQTDTQYVQDLYHTVLGRDADASGLANWTQALSKGTSRADVAFGFVFSAEHLNMNEGNLAVGVFAPSQAASNAALVYYAVLGRAPDADGLAHFASQNSPTLQVGELLQSSEFQSHFGALTGTDLIDQVYQNADGRAPTAAETQNVVTQSTFGAFNLDFAIANVATSPEAFAHHLGQVSQGWHLT